MTKRTTTYAYDGNLTRLVGVYDEFTRTTYDSLNRVTTLQQFDLAQGLGASLIDGFSGDSHALDSKRVDYTYDANGQVIAEIRYAALDGSDPVAATYTRYDTMGHVTELDHILYDGTGAMEMTAYAYDAGGRMIRQTGSLGTSTYAYDGDSQLIGSDVAGPNGAESYTYDANGNRTTNGTSPSGVGANNQNAGVVSAMTGASLTFAYDGEGNQARMINVDNSSTTLYAYDHRNRMTSASEAGSYSASYTYDAFDRRIGKSVDYAVSADLGEHYLWDGNDLLAVLNDNGSVSQRYLMGPGQNQVLAEETVGDTTRWALTDTIGTVRTGVDNASGHAVLFNIALADSFGNSDQNLSGVGIRMGFTGYQYDKESGDYYAEARYYSPLQGKFTSEDPRGFEAGDPNLGRYVGNNPLTYTDPSGMASTGLHGGRGATPHGPKKSEVQVLGPVLGDMSARTLVNGAYSALKDVWRAVRSFIDAFPADVVKTLQSGKTGVIAAERPIITEAVIQKYNAIQNAYSIYAYRLQVANRIAAEDSEHWYPDKELQEAVGGLPLSIAGITPPAQALKTLLASTIKISDNLGNAVTRQGQVIFALETTQKTCDGIMIATGLAGAAKVTAEYTIREGLAKGAVLLATNVAAMYVGSQLLDRLSNIALDAGMPPELVGAGQELILAVGAFIGAKGLQPPPIPPMITPDPVAAKTSPAINPSEVAGKTPAEIDAIAREKGLIPKGPDPMNGQGSYVDPVTGRQRILIHPGEEPPAVHVNDPSGGRLDINGNPVPRTSPDAHLPMGGQR